MKQAKRAKRRQTPVSGWTVLRHCTRRGLLQTTALQAVTAAAVLIGPVPAFALPPNTQPTGGQVVAGQASIAQTQTQTTITQTSPNAAVNWTTFNVGRAQTVQFKDPSASSVTVNTVTSPNPSEIAGRITSNGTVVLINRDGIVFERGAQVDVGGLVASAAGMTKADLAAFMANGHMAFDQAANPGARIVNNGTLSIADHGLATLVAPQVRNAGTIQAKLGSVVLAGAETFALDLYGDGMVGINVTGQVTTAPNGTKALITNEGVISANGGTVVLSANAVDGVVQTLVNAGGTIAANSVGAKTGRVVIAGAGGDVIVTGKVTADGGAAGTTGGAVAINSSGTVTLAPGAKVTASGPAGGGTIAVGTTLKRAAGGPSVTAAHTAKAVVVDHGATIAADATATGNGGTVTVLSTASTTMNGLITAKGGKKGGNGGKVEVSGGSLSITTGSINVAAPLGSLGTILFDPLNLDIVASGGNLDGTFSGSVTTAQDTGNTDSLSTSVLNNFVGNVSLQALQTLDVQSSFSLAAGALTMEAGKNISIETGVSVGASGNIILAVGGAGPGTPPAASASPLINVAGTVASSGGSVSLLTGPGGTIAIATNGSLNAPTSGKSITLLTDALSSTGAVTALSGTIEVAPATQGNAIAFGAGGAGTLQVSSAVLAGFKASVLRLGAATINGAQTIYAGDINFDTTVNLTGIASTLDVHGSGDITRSADTNVLTVGTLTGSSGGDLNLAGGVSTGNVIGTIGSFSVGSNNQFELLTNGGVTIAGPVNAGTLFYAADVSGANPTIAVTGSIGATQSAILSSVAGTIGISGTINTPSFTLGTYGTVQITGASAVIGQAAGTLALGAAGGATEATTGTILAGTILPVSGIGLGSISLPGTANTVSNLGSLNVTGSFLLASKSALTVSDTLAASGGVVLQTSAAGGITVAAGGSLTASGSRISLLADALTNGGTIIAATVEIAPNSSTAVSLGGAGGLSLSQASLSKIAATTLRLGGVTIPGGGITTTASGISVLGSVNLSGIATILDLQSKGAVNEGGSGTLTHVGTLTGSTGSVALTNGGDSVGTIGAYTAASGGLFALTQAGSAVIAGPLSANNVAVNTGSAPLSVTGSVASSGTVALNGGTVTLSGSASVSGSAITLTGTNGITLTGSAALGQAAAVVDLDVPVSGGVSQAAGATILAGVLQSSAGVTGSVALSGAANTIASVGSFTVTGGGFAVTSTGSLNLAGSLAASGTVAVNAGTIGVGSAGNVQGSTITLTGSHGIALAGGGSVGQTGAVVDLDVPIAGGVTQAANATIVASTLRSSAGVAGSVKLPGTANAIGGIGNFAVTGGDFLLADTKALTIGGLLTASGSLYLQTSDTTTGIQVTGSAAAGGTSLVSFQADKFANSGTMTGGIFELAPNTTGNTIALGAGGYLASVAGIGTPVVRIGAVTEPGGTLTTTAGSIAVTGAFGSGTTALQLYALGTISETAGLVLTASTLSGSAAAIALGSSLNAIGSSAGLTSGGNLNLGDNQPLTVTGSLAVGNGDTLTLSTGSGGIAIGVSAGSAGVLNAGTVVLSAAGGITEPNGSVIATALTATAGAGSILLTNPNNAIGTVTGLGAGNGNVVLVVDPPTVLTGAYTGNNLFFEVAVNGGTLQLGSAATGATLSATAASNPRIGFVADHVTEGATASTITATGGSVELAPFNAATAVALGGVAGTWDQTLLGLIAASGATTLVAGPFTDVPNGSTISLMTGSLGVAGTVTMANVVLNAGTIGIGGFVNAATALALGASAGGVSETGAITAGTLAGIGTIAGGVTLGGTNAIGTIAGVAVGSAGFNLVDSGNLTVAGTLTAPGSVAISTAGAGGIFVSGSIGAGTTLSIDSGSNGILLQNNALVTAPTIDLNSGAGGITIANNAVLGNTGALVDLTAGGTIAELNFGKIIAGTLQSAGGAGGTVSLGNTNTIATLGAFTVTGTNGFILTDSGSLAVAGTVSAQTIVLQAGTIGITGTLSAPNGADLSASAGGITETGGGAIDTGFLQSSSGITGGATLAGANTIAGIGQLLVTGGNLILNDTGSVLISGHVSAQNIALDAGTISLTSTLTAGTVLALGVSGGGVAETGSGVISAPTLTSNGTGTGTIVGGATLAGSNTIGVLGTMAVSGGGFTLTDTGSLSVAGVVTGPSIALNAGTIAISGFIDATTALALGAGSGGITESGSITAPTLVSLGTITGGATLTGTNTIATLGTINADAFTLVDTGSLSVAGVLSGATFSFSAGTIAIAGRLNASTLLALGASSGGVSETGSITAGTLASIGTIVGGLTLTGGNTIGVLGTLPVTGGNFTLVDTGSLSVAGVVSAPNIFLTAGTIGIPGSLNATTLLALNASTGGITESGGITAATLTSTGIGTGTITGGATLSGTNTIAALGTINADSFTLVDTGSLSVGGPVNAATVALTAGTIGISGAIDATSLLAFGAGAGGISETGSITAGTLVSLGTIAGNATLVGANTIATLGSFAVGGSILNVSDTGSLLVAGVVSITGGGPGAAPAIFLSAGTIGITGTLNATANKGEVVLGASSGGIAESGAGAIDAGFLTTSGTIVGGVTLGGANTIAVLGGATVTGGNYTLVDTGSLTFVGLLTAPNISLNAGTIAIGSNTTAGTINAGTLLSLGASAGGISESNLGLIIAPTLTSLGAITGGLTLGTANQIGTLGAFAYSGGMSLNDTGSLTIAAGVTADSLVLTATSLAIGGSGILNVGTIAIETTAGGVTELTASGSTGQIITSSLSIATAGSGDVSLSNPANQILASTGITVANGKLVLVDDPTLTLTGAYSASNLFFQVTQAGDTIALGAGTPATLTAGSGGRISLIADNLTENAASTITAPGGGTVEIAPFSTTAAESLAGASQLRVDTTLLGNINTGTGGTLVIGRYTGLDANPTITAAGISLDGAATVTGKADTLVLASLGSITQTAGSLSVLTLTGTAAAGSVALSQSGNNVGTLAAFGVGSGAFSLADTGGTGAVTVTGPVTGALVEINANTITVPGVIAASIAIQLIAQTGGIVETATGTLNATSSGEILLTAFGGGVSQAGNAGTIIAGTLTGQAAPTGTASLFSATNTIGTLGNFAVSAGNFLLKDTGTVTATGSVGANNITLNAGSIVLSATNTLSTAGTVDLTTTAGGVTQAAAGTITAGTLLSSGNIAGGSANLAGSLNAIGTLTHFTVTAGDLNLRTRDAGLLTVAGNAANAVTANNVTITAGTLAQNGILNAATGMATLVATVGALTQAGSVNAVTGASLTGHTNLDNTVAGVITVTNGPATLIATTGTLGQSGSISATSGGTLTAATFLTNSGSVVISAGPAVLQATTNDLTQSNYVQGTSVSETAGGAVNHSGTSKATTTSATLIAHGSTLNQSGSVGAVTAASLTAQTNLNNTLNGVISVTNGPATLIATTGTLGQAGSVSATSGGTLTAATFLTNSGSVVISAGPAVLQATTNDLTQSNYVQGTSVSETAGGALTHSGTSKATSTAATLIAHGSTLNQSGTVSSVTAANLTAQTNLDNTASGLVTVSTGSATLVATTGTLGQAGTVSAVTLGTLTAQTNLTNSGTVTISGTAGAAGLTANTGTLTQSGTVQTTGTAGSVTETATLGNFTHSGLTSAGSGGATIAATAATFTQTGGTITAANGTVGVTAGLSVLQNAGTIQTTGNGGTLIAVTANGTNLGNGITQAAGALIQTQATGVATTITLVAADLVSLGGTIQAGSTAANNGSVGITAGGTQFASGVSVSAGTALTQTGTVTGGSSVSATATIGDIAFSGTTTAGAGGLTAQALNGSIGQTKGILQDVNTGAVLLTASATNNVTGGTIAQSGGLIQAAGNNIGLTASHLVRQSAGTIQTTTPSGGAITVAATGTAAADGISQTGGTIAAAADTTLTATNTISLASLLSAGGNVLLSAGGSSVSHGGIVSGVAITQTGTVTGGIAVTETAALGDIVLGNSGTIGTVTAGAGGISWRTGDGSITETNGTIQANGGPVHLVAATNTLDVSNTGGTITQTVGLIAAVNGSVSATADISIGQTGGTIQTSGTQAGDTVLLVSNGTGAATGIALAGTVQSIGPTGSVSATAQGGTLAQNGTVSGNVIALTAYPGLTNTGSVLGIGTGNTASLTALSGTITQAGLVSATTVTESASTNLTHTGTTSAGSGGASLSAGGNVTQTGGLIAATNGTIGVTAGLSVTQNSGTIATSGTNATGITLTARGTAIGQGVIQAAAGLIQATGTLGTVTVNAANLVTLGGTVNAPDVDPGDVIITAGGTQFVAGATTLPGNALTLSGNITGGDAVSGTATAGDILLNGSATAGAGGLTLLALDGSVLQTNGLYQAINGGTVTLGASVNPGNPTSGNLSQTGGTLASGKYVLLTADRNVTQSLGGTISGPQINFFSSAGTVGVAGTLTGLLPATQQPQAMLSIQSGFPSVGANYVGSTDGLFITLGSPTTYIKQFIDYSANASLASTAGAPSGHPQLVVTVNDNQAVGLNVNAPATVAGLTDMFLVLKTGAGSGTINVASLHVSYKEPGTNGQVVLEGTVNGVSGSNAAGLAFISPGRKNNYTLNGCPIESLNCVRITTLNVPVDNPLKDIEFGPTPPPADINIMLPDVGELDY